MYQEGMVASGFFDEDEGPLERLHKVREMRQQLAMAELEIVQGMRNPDRLDAFISLKIDSAGREGIHPTTLITAARTFSGLTTKDVSNRLDRLRSEGVIELVSVLPLPGRKGASKKRYRAIL